MKIPNDGLVALNKLTSMQSDILANATDHISGDDAEHNSFISLGEKTRYSSMDTNHDATSTLSDIIANATDHTSEGDAELNSVISLVEKTIYSSMDASHKDDIEELNAVIDTASQCNADVEEADHFS